MKRTPLVSLALVILCATVASGEAQAAALPRSTQINTLSVYTLRDGKKFARSERVTITIDENKTGKLRLSFIEDEIDGYGDQWRAAAWVSSLMAVDLTGADPTKIQVEFERSGRVDGPSAGGLTTIGILAALRGDEVRADAAMTGSINPDGTIGPVGGIPHKIDGAVNAGMKLVLIPYGSRVGRDSNTGKEVDLFARGRDQGVEVKAVGDIYTAYKLMTGKELPRPAAAQSPELNDQLYGRIKIKIDEWLLRATEYKKRYQRVPVRYQTDWADNMITESDRVAGRVKQALIEGQIAIAFRDALAAAVYASNAAAVGETIWVDQVRGRKTGQEYARTISEVKSKMDIAIKRLKQYKPKTISEAGALLYGYTALTEAMAYQAAAEELLAGRVNVPVNSADYDQAEENMLSAAVCTQIAALDCEHIRDLLEIADELEGQPMPQDAPLELAADYFRRAAQANLNQFEKVTVEDWAEKWRQSPDNVRARLMQNDEAYLVVKHAFADAMPQMYKHFEGESLQFARLGLAIHTYTLSSSLLAKHYSLGVLVDRDFNITGVSSESSLRFMLDFAEDQSKRNIQVLKDNNVDPGLVVFSYQAASILRGRELEDRLSALQWLWEANIKSRTLAHLGGFAAPE